MRTLVIATVLGLLTASGAHAQAPRPQVSPPIFRSDVTRVEVTVQVVDGKGVPVAGLGRADFTITEDGEPQVIRSFSAVSRPTESLALAEPALPVSSDYATVAAPVSNQHMSHARVVALVLDDLHIGPLRTSLAQDAARRFVERLAPSDLLYVVRTATGASTGTFSRDRARALMLIGGLRGARIGDDTVQTLLHAPGTQPQRADSHRLLTETLVGVSKALQGVLGHSKTMVLISEGSSYGAPVDRLEARPQQRIDEATAPGGRVGAMSDAAMALADVTTAAASANVVIHTVSPTGLNNRVGDDIQLSVPLSDDDRRRIESEARQARDMLRELAEGSGGIAVVDRNDVLESIDRTVARLDTHYLLSYDSSAVSPRRGQRRIEVTVARPDVRVHARRGYTAPDPDAPALLSADDSLPLPMRALLSPVVPVDEVAMQAQAVAVSRSAEGTTYAVVVEARGAGLHIDGDGACRLEQGLLTVDKKGKAANGRRREMAFKVPPGQREQLSTTTLRSLWAVTLPPGRHQVRVATLDAATGRGGAVYLDLDVPSATRAPDLFVSSELQASMPTLFADEQVKRWATPMPAATRVFAVGDVLTVQVPQEEGVPLRASLTSADGQTVWAGPSGTTPSGGGPRLEVPLDVAAGSYHLLVESSSGRVTTPIAVVEMPE